MSWVFLASLYFYLSEGEGKHGDGQHDLAGSDENVLRDLPQHMQAVGRCDDHIHCGLEKGFSLTVPETPKYP